MKPPLWHIAVGFVVTFILGLFVRRVMKYAGRTIPLTPPSDASDKQKHDWEMIIKGNESGAILGSLERIIFFAAFLAEAHIAVAAWLAFKVASKWNAWENVIAIPKKIDGVDDLNFLVARSSLGSHVLMTFQIGTAYNIIAGLFGALIARHLGDVLTSLGF